MGLSGPIGELNAVAVAELRSRRLIRTWLFVALAVVAVFGAHALIAWEHAHYQRGGVLAGIYTPRFAVSWLGAVWLWLFLAAAVFLGFDARLRDLRERVADVLDARPLSNPCLLGGRLVGLVLTVWLPLVAAICLIQVVGLASETIHDASGGGDPTLLWLIGASIEPVSLTAFVLIDALPALALVVALVLFLASTLRNRLLTVLIALTLIGLHVALLGVAPVYLLPAASLVASHADIGSDILPRLVEGQVLLQRASLLLLAGGFLAFAAAVDRRRDDGSSARRIGFGVGLLALGATGIGTVAMDGVRELRQRDRWLAVHEAVGPQGLADVERITGTVRIDPGRSLALDLALRLKPPEEPQDRLVFSFNPGLEVARVYADGADVPFSHEDGLLKVNLAGGAPGRPEVVLGLQAAGIPDGDFAYLDSAVDWRRLNSANPLLLLGTEASIFESAYVALPADVHWLPSRGPNLADPIDGRDFYSVDLTVDLPEGWLVAGPGRRQPTPVASRFRFAPDAPVPGVGLFAARFERSAVEVSGIEFELLVTPRHQRNVRLFAAAEKGLVDWLVYRLKDADALGIPYPYGGFSVVEVPGRLRGYGGGWRLDTALFPPGLMLMRETGFPTARLDRVLHGRSYPTATGSSGLPTMTVGSWPDETMQVLRNVYGWTHAGGNHHQAARNLGFYQVGASGAGGMALDVVCLGLVTRLLWRDSLTVSGRAIGPTGFSAHQFDMRTKWGVGIGPMIGRRLGGPNPRILQVTPNRPPVWEAAERTSLLGIADSGVETRLAADVLSLKGGAVAQALVALMGRDGSGRLVAELVRRHAGGSFDLEDLLELADELDLDIPSVVVDWLTGAGMPGFLASDVTMTRVADDGEGRPRHRLAVHIRNDEPTPGMVGFVYHPPAIAEPVLVAGETAVEIVRVFNTPPREVWLKPYLSLNRNEARLTVIDGGDTAETEVFVGVRPSEWRPSTGAAVVVDDLDPGFSPDRSATDSRGFGRPPGPGVHAVFDRGLPESSGIPESWWTRRELPTGYGKYRRTAAWARSGEDDLRAIFTAALPSGRRWRLDYHVPDLGRLSPYLYLPVFQELGEYDIVIIDAAGAKPAIGFDATQAAKGWNTLGDFELDPGEVDVVVAASSAGQVLVADAIRWTPVDR